MSGTTWKWRSLWTASRKAALSIRYWCDRKREVSRDNTQHSHRAFPCSRFDDKALSVLQAVFTEFSSLLKWGRGEGIQLKAWKWVLSQIQGVQLYWRHNLYRYLLKQPCNSCTAVADYFSLSMISSALIKVGQMAARWTNKANLHIFLCHIFCFHLISPRCVVLSCTTTSLYTDCCGNLYAGSPSYLLILFSALSAFAVGGLSIERNQKPLAPEITLAVTHHDRQKQVEVKRSSCVNPHEIRLFSGCPYYFTLPMNGNHNSFPQNLRQPREKGRSLCMDMYHIIFSESTVQGRKERGAHRGKTPWCQDRGKNFLEKIAKK